LLNIELSIIYSYIRTYISYNINYQLYVNLIIFVYLPKHIYVLVLEVLQIKD